MAITTITSGINTEKGISYSAITDSSIDWTGITNDTYFYNLEDDLPYYKNTSGIVLSIFDDGSGVAISGGTYSGGTLTLNDNSGGSVDITGVTSPNLYTSDDTIGSGRVATLTDTLTFSGGANTAFKLYSTLRADDIFQVFFNGGGEWLAKNGSIDIGAGITYSNYYTRFTETGIKSYGAGSVVHEINNTNGDVYFMNGYMASGNFTIGSNSPIGSEFISLQGLTLINDYLIQDANTSAIADGTLVNDSFSFHIDGGALAGRYKDNLGVVSDLTIGGYATDVLGIADSNGVYTFYSDFASATAAASAGDTIEMFGDITETGNVTVTIPSGVNLNMNGHTYTLDGQGIDAIAYAGTNTKTSITNGKIIHSNSGTLGSALYISGSPDLVDCTGLTVIGDGLRCLRVDINTAVHYTAVLIGGSFIYNGVSTNDVQYVEGIAKGSFFNTSNGYIITLGLDDCYIKGAIIGNNSALITNCRVENDSTHAGIYINGSNNWNGVISNTNVFSENSDAINVINKVTVSNCFAESNGGYGIYAENSEVTNCFGKSSNTYGILVGSSSSKATDCTGESSVTAGFCTGGNAILVRCSGVSTLDTSSGHGFYNQGSGDPIMIDCFAKVVNTSAYAIQGSQATDAQIIRLSGQGMTTLIGTNITNIMSNSTDNFGNILLG